MGLANDPEWLRLKAKTKAIRAEKEAFLLGQSEDVKLCHDPACPGPELRGGGCPMGYVGSCQMMPS